MTAELRAEVPDDVVAEVIVDEVELDEDVGVVEDVVELVGLEDVVEEPADVDDIVGDEDIEVVVEVVRLVGVEEVVEEPVDDEDDVDAVAEEDVPDEVETAVSGRAPRINARRRGWATGVWTFVPREK